jgi:hypothetical protein
MHDPTESSGSQEVHDPLIRARLEGDKFTYFWFKEGQSLTKFEKFAYGFVSVLHIAISTFFIQWYWLSFRSKDLLGMLFSGSLSVVLVALGVLGLRNALKRKKVRQAHSQTSHGRS